MYHAFTAEVIQLLLNYELQASDDLIEVTVLSLFQDTKITQYETTDYYCINVSGTFYASKRRQAELNKIGQLINGKQKISLGVI